MKNFRNISLEKIALGTYEKVEKHWHNNNNNNNDLLKKLAYMRGEV